MNVVDSSGLLEYFANASNADFFAPAITDEPRLVVPTICMFEVLSGSVSNWVKNRRCKRWVCYIAGNWRR